MFHWEIDHQLKLVRHRYTGSFDGDEIFKAFHEMYQHPDFRSEYNAIGDLSQASTELDPGFVPKMQQMIGQYMDNPGRTAVVVQQPWITMLADFFVYGSTSQREYKLFYEYETAEKWVLENSKVK